MIKKQSAIKECRDQLFLDTADGARLDAVTSNLGLDRPTVGILGDDQWRALAKAIALQPKLVPNIFNKILDILLGPKTSRIGCIKTTANVGDSIVELVDSSDLVQLGTITIDPGLPTEETVDFSFRDLLTHEIFVDTPLLYDHNAVVEAESVLISGSPTTLILADSSAFPTTNYPYSVIVDRGNENEEVVSVTNNNVITNTLSCAVTKTHSYFKSKTFFVQKFLEEDVKAGQNFLILDVNDTRVFPAQGYVHITGGPNREVLFYRENQVENNTLLLSGILAYDHTAGESIELVDPGSSVETVSILQQGVSWDVFETEKNKIKIFIPDVQENMRLLDASYIHGEGTSLNGSTLSADALIGDTELSITDITPFLGEAAEVWFRINAGKAHIHNNDWFSASDGVHSRVFFENKVTGGFVQKIIGSVIIDLTAVGATIDNLITAYANAINGVGSGSLDVTAANSNPWVQVTNNQVGKLGSPICELQFTEPALYNLEDSDTEVGKGIGYAGADYSMGLVTIDSSMDVMYVEVDTGASKLILSEPLLLGFASGKNVILTDVAYSSNFRLQDGNLRSPSGGLVSAPQFPGPYVYSPGDSGPSVVYDTLATKLPFPTKVAYSQSIGNTNIEVENAFSWYAIPFTPFPVRIGRNTGYSEDRYISDRTLKKDCSSTIQTNTGSGSSTLPVADTTVFPTSDGTHPAGYRVIVNEGGAHEETLVVNQIATVGTPGVISFTTLTTKLHNVGETIKLLNDVLTFNQPFTQPHTESQLVEMLVSEINLNSVTGFPSHGTVILNFGKERIKVRKRILNVNSSTSLEFQVSSDFPMADFPYPILVGQGNPNQEWAMVSANDGRRLTLSSPLVGSFTSDDYVEFYSGDPTEVDYYDIDSTALQIATPLVLPSGYTEGESVILRSGESESPTDGSGYSLKVPPDPVSENIRTLFDLVRAAGVEVIFITNR